MESDGPYDVHRVLSMSVAWQIWHNIVVNIINANNDVEQSMSMMVSNPEKPFMFMNIPPILHVRWSYLVQKSWSVFIAPADFSR